MKYGNLWRVLLRNDDSTSVLLRGLTERKVSVASLIGNCSKGYWDIRVFLKKGWSRLRGLKWSYRHLVNCMSTDQPVEITILTRSISFYNLVCTNYLTLTLKPILKYSDLTLPLTSTDFNIKSREISSMKNKRSTN